MVADALVARDGRDVLAVSRSDDDSVLLLRNWVLRMHAAHRAGTHHPQDPGPMAPHFHEGEDGRQLHRHDGDDHDHSHLNAHAHPHDH
jgi:urease accessory protein